MKKKYLSLLVLPLILASCNGGGVSFATMREKINNISDDALYPYYKVVGSADFNNMTYEIDAEFANEPGASTFVPYSRYNDGFYNATLDTSEADLDNIVIYSMASKSYWLRAPLRINKSNFYTEVYTVSSATANGTSITINEGTGKIGDITLKDDKGEEVDYIDVKIADVNNINLLIDAYIPSEDDEEKTYKALTFTRQGEAFADFLLEGTFTDDFGNEIVIKKGARENTTCAHYILQHIITSYIGQTGSTNPSKNQMKMEFTSSGGFVFYGEAVHTTLYIDNLPYYPDPSEHPEIGEWDPEYPIPCYKNKLNAKVNVRFEYNAEGWLIKESLSTLNYDYSHSTASQASLVAVYGYKFN